MQAGTTEAGTAEADTTEAGTTVEEGGFQPPVKICEGHGFGLMLITLVEAPDFGPGSADFQSARKKLRPLVGFSPGGAAYNAKSVQELSPTTNRG
jgi:hypothetical protein